MQTGYNLLYGCWKYSWDADCELFLKILRGEVKEEVYVEQIQLQASNRHKQQSALQRSSYRHSTDLRPIHEEFAELW